MSTEDPMQVEQTGEDLSGDGGVMKTVLVEAVSPNFEKPLPGTEVSVHYTGTLLDGHKFDSSVDRNQPFNFTIDAGNVIKGWDIAVKSMRKGEKAKFVLASKYAYGEAGSPPKIPKNATLVFEIELLSFQNEKDITKDGGVLKKQLKQATEKYGQSPKYETKCKVRLVCSHNGVVVEKHDELDVEIGEEQVVAGVEKAIESLKVGETALFTIKPEYAYGGTGNPNLNIPANATLSYEIELISMQRPKEDWELDGVEAKIEEANKRKNQGNELYGKGLIIRAMKKYNKGLDYVLHMGKLSVEDKTKVNAVKLPCHLNLAQCYLKSGDTAKALEQCKNALDIDGSNVKALFRLGLAYSAMSELELAKRSFTRALEIDPNNADVKREYTKLQAAIREQERKDRALYSRMFNN